MQCNVLAEAEKIDVLYGAAPPAMAGRVRRARRRLRRRAGRRWRPSRARASALGLWTLPESARPAPARRLLAWGCPWPPRSCLALGAALALRGSELRYEGGRLSFRIGPADDQPLRQPDRRSRTRVTNRSWPPCARPSSVPSAAGLSRGEVEAIVRESEARQSQRFLARFEEFKERSDSAAPPRHGASQRRSVLPRRQERPARRPDQRAHELHAASVLQEVDVHDPALRDHRPRRPLLEPSPRGRRGGRPSGRPPDGADGPRPGRGRGEPAQRARRPRGSGGVPGGTG